MSQLNRLLGGILSPFTLQMINAMFSLYFLSFSFPRCLPFYCLDLDLFLSLSRAISVSVKIQYVLA